MTNVGNILIFLGLVIIIFGVVLKFSPGFRLPGDIFIKKENFTFYFPIGMSIFLSIVLSLIFFLFKIFFKK